MSELLAGVDLFGESIKAALASNTSEILSRGSMLTEPNIAGHSYS